MTTLDLQTGHVGLNVTDLARSTTFYRRVLGLELLRESTVPGRQYAFLGNGRNLVVTLWQQGEGGFAADRAGLHHLSFQLQDLAAVRAVEATLREIGAVIRNDNGMPGEVSAAGQLFFTDPDGIRLEVYATERPARPAPPEEAAARLPACGFF